jgi:hypothetical protein
MQELWRKIMFEHMEYLFGGNGNACFAYFQCRSIAFIWWSVRDLDLGSMINFSTRVNKV